jgi:hypothetical protein
MCISTPLHPAHTRSPACASFPPQSQSNPLWWTTGNAQGATGTYQCCPADHVGTDRQNRAYCCPSAGANQRVDSVTLACCPSANFDTASGTCYQSALASVSTCASTCASNNWGSPGTCSAGERNDRTEILCCSTSTTTSKCGCPAGSWSTSTCVATCTNGCCPAAQVAYSDYPRGYRSTVCCPASGGPFQVTRTENCCPISTLGQCLSGMTEWCDIDRNNNGNRGSICCPNAGMVWRCFSLLHELVFFFLTAPLLNFRSPRVSHCSSNVVVRCRHCDLPAVECARLHACLR